MSVIKVTEYYRLSDTNHHKLNEAGVFISRHTGVLSLTDRQRNCVLNAYKSKLGERKPPPRPNVKESEKKSRIHLLNRLRKTNQIDQVVFA